MWHVRLAAKKASMISPSDRSVGRESVVADGVAMAASYAALCDDFVTAPRRSTPKNV
jgi:hypothetical protein